MINSDKAFGIVPEDLLVAGAISEAIEDIRKNPWLLDYVYNWLSKDWLSQKFYGDAEKKAAIDWFLNNKFFVSPSSLREDQIVFPMIAISLQQANEDLSSLGDINYEVKDSVDPSTILQEKDLIVLGPFSAAYDSTTGQVTLPNGFTTDDVFASQQIFDTQNRIFHKIIEITGNSTFLIEANIPKINLINAVVVGSDVKATITLESVEFKQQYAIRCFVQNEPKHLMYLSSLVRFILLRYKEKLLEGRGFQRSIISMQGPYEASSMFGAPAGEFIFGQNITLVGYVREYWPKDVSGKELGGFKSGGIWVDKVVNTPSDPSDDVGRSPDAVLLDVL